MKIEVIILFTAIQLSAFSANACEDKILDVSQLKEEWSQTHEWQGSQVVVYKGTITKSDKTNKFKRQGLITKWWDTAKYPIDLKLMKSEKRRVLDNVSVMWAHSPSYGCSVIYYPPYKTAKEPGATPYFVGKEWEGGYIDFCYMHAFNTLGQLVEIDYEHKTKAPRIIMDLYIPPYQAMPNGNIKLTCSPNQSFKSDAAKNASPFNIQR